MHPISGEPKALTNTRKKQTYIARHQDTTEYKETNTAESGWKLIQYNTIQYNKLNNTIKYNTTILF